MAASTSSEKKWAIAITALLLLGVATFIATNQWVRQRPDQTKVDKIIASSGDAQTPATEPTKTSGEDGVAATSADKKSDDAETITLTAAPGDSYTTLARQAVAKVDGSLSPAERVAAETKLTQDGGAAELAEGQSVAIIRAHIHDAIAWAKSLAAEEKQTWQSYAEQIAW